MTEQANSDELSTFVSSTLRAIAAGIGEAQGTQILSAHGTGVSGLGAPEQIEFDIAVSAKNSGAAEGGLKIAVFGISAGTGANIETESSTVSRIKFSIPTKFKTTLRPETEIPAIKTAFNQ